MTIKTLYRYEREGGGITVSTEKPDCEYAETYRIIADEGMAVTQDGVDLRTVVDTDNTEGWYEVEMPDEESAEIQAKMDAEAEKEIV